MAPRNSSFLIDGAPYTHELLATDVLTGLIFLENDSKHACPAEP